MIATSPLPNSTEYNYVYDEDTSPCNDGNGFNRFKSLFLPIIYCLVFVFCLVGNALVLWVLLTSKKVITMTDVCLLNLAISDLLFVFPLPFQARYALDQWIFGNAVCKIMAGIYYIGFYSSIFFITLMSVDRYIAIAHAVYALRARTATCGIIISVILWMTAGLASIPNMMFNQVVEIEQFLECVPIYPLGQESWRFFTQFEVNVLGLLIPFSILIYCYSQILRNVKSCKNKNKIKVIKLIFIIVVVFFLFWAPFNVVLFLDSLQSLHIINDCETSQRLALALHLTESISFIHCCLNPVIYAFVGERFKAHLQRVFHTCIRHISNVTSSNSVGHSYSSPTQVLGYSASDRIL